MISSVLPPNTDESKILQLLFPRYAPLRHEKMKSSFSDDLDSAVLAG